jgi:hypothetical protein
LKNAKLIPKNKLLIYLDLGEKEISIVGQFVLEQAVLPETVLTSVSCTLQLYKGSK